MWKSYAHLCFCNSCGHAPFVSTLRRITVHKNELRGPHSFPHTHAHCALTNPQTTRSAHSKKQKTVVPPYKKNFVFFKLKTPQTTRSAPPTTKTDNNANYDATRKQTTQQSKLNCVLQRYITNPSHAPQMRNYRTQNV